jgi:hypothetical protein
MTSAAKSIILLVFTLAVGFALGLFADATLVRGRRDRINRMGRPPGLVDHLEHVIQPRDSAQAAAIRPILQRTVDNNQLIIRQTNERLRAGMDSLRAALDSSLDADQRDRLARELRRMSRIGLPGGPGRRGGSRGRRGGPDGSRPGSTSTPAPPATVRPGSSAGSPPR